MGYTIERITAADNFRYSELEALDEDSPVQNWGSFGENSEFNFTWHFLFKAGNHI